MRFNEATIKQDLDYISRLVRKDIIEMSHNSGLPHLGSCLSCVEILIALYFKVLKISPTKEKDLLRDRFILSKGHAAPTLYSVMAHRGYFPLELLSTYATPESNLSEHPSPGCIPGFELATGSLGHGLSVGIGMALAAHIKKDRYRTYVLLSDGECNEGTVWEAALSAKAFNLQNIVAIVDYNKWQATGKSDEVLALHPLSDKWSSFGWNVQEIDGHNIGAIIDALERTTKAEQPSIIIAHTVKGKGITFILT